MTVTMVTNRCVSVGSDNPSGRDNRHISDDHASQLLSQSEILSMRGCGIAGEVCPFVVEVWLGEVWRM